MTKDKGRGVFTTKPLKKGDLIAVDKAVAFITKDETSTLGLEDTKGFNLRVHLVLAKYC